MTKHEIENIKQSGSKEKLLYVLHNKLFSLSASAQNAPKDSYKDFTKWIKEAKELIVDAEILFEEANKL
jgi:hypothetical protein